MLRFDKAIIFSPILKSNLLVSFNIKTCGLDVLLFPKFINIVSIVYRLHLQLESVRHVRYWIDLIMLFYTFLVICFDWYKEWTISPILLNKLSELLPAFTCARAIGNLWSICLGVNILSPAPLVLSCLVLSPLVLSC